MSHDDHSSLKAAMRLQARERLAGLSEAALREASARACEHLLALPVVRDAGVLMLYMPLPGEVDVTFAIEHCLKQGQCVCVPAVNWSERDMTPVAVTSLEDAAMTISRNGVREPIVRTAVDVAAVDVVVVPGLAFDANGHRLGRGGGFYDRFLAKMHAGAAKIAVAFEAQIVQRVPMAVTDVAVDVVVTEAGVVPRRNA